MASFTNDGQINQLAAMIAVFDNQRPLPGNRVLSDRLFRSSQVVKMRGTVAFERLSCPAAPHKRPWADGNVRKNTNSDNVYMRIRLNDVVYPVVGCTDGPGSSCPLSQYQQIIQRKWAEAGDFTKICNMTDKHLASQPKATFFFDNTLPWQIAVKP